MNADERGQHCANDEKTRKSCKQTERQKNAAQKFRKPCSPGEKSWRGKAEISGVADKLLRRRQLPESVRKGKRRARKNPQKRQTGIAKRRKSALTAEKYLFQHSKIFSDFNFVLE